MTRRKMLRIVAAASIAVSAVRSFAQESSSRRKRLGIGMHSCGFHWQAARDQSSQAKFSDALDFLEYSHGLGAGGVQVTIKSRDKDYARQIRTKAEANGMYFEGQLSMP